MNENYTTALRMIDAGEKEKPKNRYAQVLKRPVARALASFVEDSEFADAVVAKGDTGFSECLEAVTKGIGTSISDIEVYRRAANFYFPGCGVRFKMEIDLTAGANGRNDLLPGGEAVTAKDAELPDLQSTGNDEKAKKISIDLDDLFD